MEKFVLFGTTPIFFIDEGKGDPIILLHGYLESSLIWDDFATNLKKTHRVIRLDLPGHGLSGVNGSIHTMEYLADAVQHILKLVGVEKCTLVGHSMGGYVTLAFAKKYPSMLNGFVLFHSTPNPDTEEKKANRNREIELVKEDKMELIARTNAPNIFARDNRKRYANAIDECIEMYAMNDKEGVVALLNGMKEREDMNEFVANTEIPHMFIFGKKDMYISLEVAQSLSEKFPKAKCVWLENSGHIGFIEEEKISIETITTFANECNS
jgi:Predicted hydrolases or acyltransferases (alpha/beta hydrolase superfamily)